MNPESNVTEPWRQPRRSNNRTAAVQYLTCGAEPGWRCMVSTGGAMRRNFHKARVRSAAAAKTAGAFQNARLTNVAVAMTNNKARPGD